ncbi:MAG: hypothetical protein JST82_13755 [Bacteroidetes bacterium]|nr:hypothetical protein [Bacteroidota bacterium]
MPAKALQFGLFNYSKNKTLNTQLEQQASSKQDHTVQYIIYAAAAYFGLQYLLKPKRATAAIVTVQPTEQVVVADDTPATTKPVQPVVVPTQPIVATSTNSTESFPLHKDMKGQRVQALQQKLGVTADGIFGNQTEAALLKQYGVTTVTASQYASIMLSKVKTATPVITNTTAVLKKGSSGENVYRLQKWLGFKDRAVAKKGEQVADSAFGPQTEAALLKKTGQRSIAVNLLNQYTKKQ